MGKKEEDLNIIRAIKAGEETWVGYVARVEALRNACILGVRTQRKSNHHLGDIVRIILI
jgi:hypothetical protein